jgi:hypothetical protein
MTKSKSPKKDVAPPVDTDPEMAAKAREALNRRNSKK